MTSQANDCCCSDTGSRTESLSAISGDRGTDRRDAKDLRVEQIWYEFHARLRGFLVARTGSEQLADDIVQDVFVKVYGAIDSVRNEELIASWLFRIARNAMVDHYRRLRHEQPIDDGLGAAELPDRAAPDPGQKLAENLPDMLESLPPRYREPLRLIAVEGLTQAEMATRLQLSISGGKSRVQRGRERLRRLLVECCDIELDRHGGIIDYTVRSTCCGARRHHPTV